MSMCDKSKFSFQETFNNSDGKTSGSGFIGVILGLISALGFIIGSVGFFLQFSDTVEYLKIVLNLALISAALLGVRKMDGIFKKNKENDQSQLG